MTTTEARSLETVLPDLGAAYKAWKSWEADKNRHKDEFFLLATEQAKVDGLAAKLVAYPASDLDAAEARALLHNPGWTVVEARPDADHPGEYEFILQEDPALKAFSHELDGVKYARQISQGPVLVDEEWLCEEDYDLYLGVTVALPWGERMLVPLNHLEAENLSALARYVYNDKPRVQLAAPRPVKESQ